MLTRNRFDITRHLLGVELREDEFLRRLAVAVAGLLGKEGTGAIIYFETTVNKLVELGLVRKRVTTKVPHAMYRLTNRGLQAWRKSREEHW